MKSASRFASVIKQRRRRSVSLLACSLASSVSMTTYDTTDSTSSLSKSLQNLTMLAIACARMGIVDKRARQTGVDAQPALM